jgi:biopolymer transport protein ExbB
MEPSAIDGLGFAHFLTQTDGVGKAVLGTLLLLSVSSWYLIVTRFVANALAQRKADAFLRRFWQATSLTEVEASLRAQPADNAFASLVQRALEALADSGKDNLAVAGGMTEYLTRTLNNEVDGEAAASEYGLTVLASAGSASPYVGLFGTVWGIYHALVQIGLSGQGTLDKVAGPVGGTDHDRPRPGRGHPRRAGLQRLQPAQPHVAVPPGVLRPRPVRAAYREGRQWQAGGARCRPAG